MSPPADASTGGDPLRSSKRQPPVRPPGLGLALTVKAGLLQGWERVGSQRRRCSGKAWFIEEPQPKCQQRAGYQPADDSNYESLPATPSTPAAAGGDFRVYEDST